MEGCRVDDKRGPDIGKQISDTVRTALESGDLTRLRELGPVVQNVVKEGMASAAKSLDNPQARQVPPQQTPPPPHGYGPSAAPQAGHSPQQVRQAAGPARQVATQQGWQSRSGALRPTLPRGSYGVGSVVMGVIGMVAFGLAAVGLTIAGLAMSALGGMIYVIGGLAVPFLCSIGLLGGGIGKRGLVKRLRAYLLLFGDKNVLTIEEICAATHRSPAGVRRDIRKAIEKKILRDVKMDVLETCVIRGEEAYRLYIETEEARAQREAEEAARERRMQDPSLAPIEVFREEGKLTIQKIREANRAITGQEFSEKLDRLELTTTRIFSYVEAHPEKLPDTRKFMNYYLPTTLKLVEKYRQYDQLDVEMENVRGAKADITRSLDTIDLAFNNLLESLYREDTLDVVTDIEVLQTMLEQEGLTSKKFEIDDDPDIKLQ